MSRKGSGLGTSEGVVLPKGRSCNCLRVCSCVCVPVSPHTRTSPRNIHASNCTTYPWEELPLKKCQTSGVFQLSDLSLQPTLPVRGRMLWVHLFERLRLENDVCCSSIWYLNAYPPALLTIASPCVVVSFRCESWGHAEPKMERSLGNQTTVCVWECPNDPWP